MKLATTTATLRKTAAEKAESPAVSSPETEQHRRPCRPDCLDASARHEESRMHRASLDGSGLTPADRKGQIPLKTARRRARPYGWNLGLAVAARAEPSAPHPERGHDSARAELIGIDSW